MIPTNTYQAYNLYHHGGGLDPQQRYWYLMDDRARALYDARHAHDLERAIEKQLPAILEREVAKGIKELFGGKK